MRKLRYTLIALLFASLPLFATGDSLSYLFTWDSVFLSRNAYNQKFIHHTLAPGQTLYGLAKHWGFEVDDLLQTNTHLSDDNYGPGDEVRIQIPNAVIVRYPAAHVDMGRMAKLYYIVRPGDTMYGLSNRIFDMSESFIMHRNNLTDYTLTVGQKLHIGWISIDGIREEVRLRYGATPMERLSNEHRRLYRHQLGERKERIERGKAVWTNAGEHQLYVLHRTAPKGSVVRVYSSLYNRTFYARVLGRIPAGRYNSTVRAVLSKGLAQALGAVDRTMVVEIGR